MGQSDIRMGSATVPIHADGGWALPGRQRTENRIEAMAAAAEIDRLMGCKDVPQSVGAKLAAQVAKQPALITRRKGGFFQPVQNRV